MAPANIAPFFKDSPNAAMIAATHTDTGPSNRHGNATICSNGIRSQMNFAFWSIRKLRITAAPPKNKNHRRSG